MLGDLSLDFAATADEDRGDLGRMLVRLGALSFEVAARPEEVADAERLCAAVRQAFNAAAAGSPLTQRDVATINSYASDDPPALVLRTDGSATRGATDPVRAGLAAIARDAIETIARHAGDLRACEGKDCDRTFLDRSRAKGRRWCSMQRCGNRVKVAAFRSRRG